MNEFERAVLETVRQYHMIEPGEPIVVGLSGGADSVCLIAVLTVLRGRLQCEIAAVHVHHGLRESADRDEGFCRELCEGLGIPLTVVHENAAEYAAAHGLGVEEAGRAIRYAAFRNALEQCRNAGTHRENSVNRERADGRIATAHHREDLAETVLHNLCRGSGIGGLSGIRPITGDIIRPLLYQSRDAIERYLMEQHLPWCEDETNWDTRYTRNYLRIETLPGLCSHVNAGTIDHLVRFAEEAAQIESRLAQETGEALERCRASQGLSVHALMREPSILRSRILRELLVQAAGCSKDLAAVHIEALLSLCSRSDGTARIDLPYGLTAVRAYDILTIQDRNLAESGTDPGDDEYRMRVFCREDAEEPIPCSQYTKWFDYDRIGAFPVIRTRASGDVITIGGGVVKSLRRFMIDDKVPRDMRDLIRIPFAGNQALWIPEHQMNAAFKVTDVTRRILEITYVPDSASSAG